MTKRKPLKGLTFLFTRKEKFMQLFGGGDKFVQQNELKLALNSIKQDLTNKFSQLKHPVQVFDNLDQIKAKYPSGTDGAMFTLDNGHVFVYDWNANQWKDFGAVQTLDLSPETQKVLNSTLRSGTFLYDNPSAPFDDLDTLPANQVVTYSADTANIKNWPKNAKGKQGTVISMCSSKGVAGGGAVQILTLTTGETMTRVNWGWPAKYGKWSSGIISSFEIQRLPISSPYDDLNTLPANSAVLYAPGLNKTKNSPQELNEFGEDSGQVITFNNFNNLGTLQFLFSAQGIIAWREVWITNDHFMPWHTWVPNELQKPKPSLALFSKIGIVGDSYASGELAMNGKYVDHYNMSWGQILGRKIGAKVINYSRGGQTTQGWLSDTERGLGLLNNTSPQDLYILALGINDYAHLTLGEKADITQKKDTFYSCYAQIINAIKQHAPAAKIIMSTLSQTTDVAVKFSQAIVDIANYYKIPYITLNSDKFFTSDYYLNHMYGGHPTGPVYAEMANAYERLISKALVDNLSYFEDYEESLPTDNDVVLQTIPKLNK